MSRREILEDTLARLEAERYAPLPPLGKKVPENLCPQGIERLAGRLSTSAEAVRSRIPTFPHAPRGYPQLPVHGFLSFIGRVQDAFPMPRSPL